MSYPQWPDSLPQIPLRDGFSVSGDQPLQRQQMEVGLDRVTRTSSSSRRRNTYSIVCTETQLAEFWSFYENEANAGADLIIVPMITGNKIIPHLCRIASYPALSPDGLEWRVTMTLETDELLINWS